MSAHTARGRSAADLAALLARASTVQAAADATVDHLVEVGFSLPSVYLEQAGRLRCLAQRGYWQTLDGIPCDVGVMGRAFRSGRTVEIDDARSEAEFLFAAPDLLRQISVPVHGPDRVVGTLNIESRAPFPAGARATAEQVASEFEVRLAELGGPPEESVAQRVARLASAMTELTDEAAIHRSVLAAAIEVAGTSTAALLEPDVNGCARIVASEGPLGGALAESDPIDLGQLDAFVLAGSSLYASGTEASDLVMHGRLRDAGVGSLAVVPLRASGEHLGCLVMAEATQRAFEPVVMPILEILGAQAAASIRAARTLAELRQQARQDPLTELGHHATFQEELRARLHARSGDRRASSADRHVALLLIDVDEFKQINDRDGHREGDRVLREVSRALASALRTGDQLYRIGGDEFATVVEVGGVVEAEGLARRMVAAARLGPTTVSVGIAIASDGETADELVDRADQAMYDAKRAGRDTAGVAPQTRDPGRGPGPPARPAP